MLRFRGKTSLSFQILTVVLSISSVVTAILTLAQLSYEYSHEYATLKGNFKIVQETSIGSLTTAVWEVNEPQILEELRGITRLPGILGAKIESDGKVLYSSGTLIAENSLVQAFDLTQNQTHLGTLTVYADLSRVRENVLQKALLIFFSQLFKTLIVSALLYFAFQKFLTLHLINLSRQAQTIDPRVSLQAYTLKKRRMSPPDELDHLVDSLNKMQHSLRTSWDDLENLNRDLERKVQEKTSTILKQRQLLEYSSKMSVLGKMAAGMAHEINTPLAAIGMSSELVAEILNGTHALSEDDRALILQESTRIQSSSARIAEIIKSLRFFSRTGEQDPFQKTTVKAILEDTLQLCRASLEDASIQLDIAELPVNTDIECHPVQISQVLLNLLNNSKDALETKIDKRIRIVVKESPHDYQILVSDNGSGVSDEIREKVMDPFFTTKDVGKGTGLGLSLSKGFIERHNGSLTLESITDETTFSIRLPKQQNKNQQAA